MAKVEKVITPWEGLEDSEPSSKYFGFVYLIECLDEGKDKGKLYIGSKRFWSVSKGIRKESDWKKYQGSNPTVKKWVNVKKTMLHMCRTNFELNYIECLEIMAREALLSNQYKNFMLGRTVLGSPPAYMRK